MRCGCNPKQVDVVFYSEISLNVLEEMLMFQTNLVPKITELVTFQLSNRSL